MILIRESEERSVYGYCNILSNNKNTNRSIIDAFIYEGIKKI